MVSGEPDSANGGLFGSDLYNLYRRELDSLGGESCLTHLGEQIEDRWRVLAVESCKRDNRAAPTEEDALRALDAVAFKLAGRIQLADLTLPQLSRILRRFTLHHWRAVVLTLVAAMTVVAALARLIYELGKRAG